MTSRPVLTAAASLGVGKDWNNQLFDCFGMPGGAGLCCYVMICPCCAAGDISNVIHEDFCVTCCVMPCIMGWPCWWAHNRKKLAEKFGIEDPYLHSPLGSATPCLLHACGCFICLLTQELNHVKAIQLSGGMLGVSHIHQPSTSPAQRVM